MKPLSPILTFAILLFSSIISAQHWQVTEMSEMPERVTNSAVAAGNIDGTDYIYSFAGLDSTKLYSGIHLKGYRYYVQGDSWDTIPPLPDNMGKIAASADRVGNVIYIIGGYHVFSNLSEVSSNKVHRYDMASNSFLSDGAPIPVPIDDQVQAVWRDSLIYVITGWSNNGNVPNVQIYNPTLDSWFGGTSVPNTNNYKSFGSTGVIYGDTIYYFGGARSSGNFGIQNDFRKGIINPDNPAEIEWSITMLGSAINGYRMAATISKDQFFWLGGSGNTYNFNGIAYNGAGGVPPLNRSLLFDPATTSYDIDNSNLLPMDLRGLGSVNDTVKYMVGGMMDNQMVSKRAFRLERIDPIVNTKEVEPVLPIFLYPNPVKEQVFIGPEHLIEEGIKYQLSDSFGQLIREDDYQKSGISVHSLTSGIYVIKVLANDRFMSLKFFKK